MLCSHRAHLGQDVLSPRQEIWPRKQSLPAVLPLPLAAAHLLSFPEDFPVLEIYINEVM